jgi:hypothetical protein
MVAIGEHAPAPPGDAVHRARQSSTDGHHAATEGVAIARFDD